MSNSTPPSADDDDPTVRALLRGAAGPPPPVDVLGGVQKRLRERSGGKFYDDAWSTARQPPTRTYLATGALMLAVLVLTWLVLAPLRGRPVRVDMAPAPVDVLPPARP